MPMSKFGLGEAYNPVPLYPHRCLPPARKNAPTDNTCSRCGDHARVQTVHYCHLHLALCFSDAKCRWETFLPISNALFPSPSLSHPNLRINLSTINLMCAPGIVAHISRQITNVSSQVSYIKLLQHKYIKVCDKWK